MRSGTSPSQAKSFASRRTSSGRPRPYPWYANVESLKRSLTTHVPASSAGRITFRTSCARAARKSSSSLRSHGGSSRSSLRSPRMSSARRVPPGSRVSMTATPRRSSAALSRATWVDLPHPSPPSNVMNLPRAIAVRHFPSESLRMLTTASVAPVSLTPRKPSFPSGLAT